MNKKLSVFLGVKEKVERTFKDCVTDMVKKFKNHQGLFKGERKTHKPTEGYFEESARIGFTPVQSTVEEQLRWLEATSKPFLDTVFSIEKTNASGKVKAELIVDGTSWGTYSSLELLRLKTTLENSTLKDLYDNLPTRSQTEIWKQSADEEFSSRDIYETEIEKGITRTTEKEDYILHDPHADKNRPPLQAKRETQIKTGDTTVQKFSGEWSMIQRANLKKRYDVLLTAVIEALEAANAVEAETSDLGSKMFDYLHVKL